MSLLHMKIIKKKENKRKNRLMLNIEKYRDVILENLTNCHLESSLRKLYGETVVCCHQTTCDECKKRFGEWLLEEAKEPVLDDVEKEYLSAVIKPFRKMIAYIVKAQDFDGGKQCIRIILQNGDGMHFPYIDDDAMYKGMEVNKEYSLEELGL